MEKRTLLALALILLVLYLSNKFIYKPIPVAEPESAAETAKASREEISVKPEMPSPEMAQPVIQETSFDTASIAMDTVVVETNRYRLLFSTRGGALVEATLLGYEYFPDGSRVKLISSERSDFLKMALAVKKDTLDLGNRLFKADRDKLVLSEVKNEGTITFSTTIGSGDTVHTTYIFANDSYVIKAHLELPRLNRSGEGWKVLQKLGPAFRPTEKDSVKDDFPNIGVAYYKDGEVEEKKMRKFDEGESEYAVGPLPWIIYKNKYFMVGLIGREDPFAGAVIRGDKDRNLFEVEPRLELEPGDRDVSYEIFIGPQDYRDLKKVGLGLEKTVEYGRWIIKPFTRLILIIMLWMHRFISNYGLVIIIFSVFTKLIFYPLTKKSLQASKDMQKLQPLIKEIKEKYKEDPKKLQEETMRLYKEHKVNPLGGCLPLLVQMPVLWALFYVFQRTIEFRGEEFIFWIKDLSAPDSPPVLPIVMGLSMFLQQRMTPSTDPRMAPMQYVMPVVLTIVFIKFPAGLVLYWTVNNIMSILQQYAMKRGDTPITKGGGEAEKGGTKSGRVKAGEK